MSTHKPVEIEELFGKIELAPENHFWSVIHTKPRCEKKLAEYALKHNISYYLPLTESSRIYQRRKVTFTKPIFPGYLFTIINFYTKRELLYSGYIVSYINVPSQKELVEELRNIWLTRNRRVEMREAMWLSEGLMVEIINGPLKGVSGIVESHKKLEEVHLQVNILHQAVSVKVDPRDVKIIGDYEIVEEEE
jgi:transcription antitermination factor NusG